MSATAAVVLYAVRGRTRVEIQQQVTLLALATLVSRARLAEPRLAAFGTVVVFRRVMAIVNEPCVWV